MPLTEKVKKIIWVKGGGHCTICREVLCLANNMGEFSYLVGDVAHIVGEQEGGPRGKSPLTVEQRNAEPNLLLLCLKHHKIVDDDPSTYTVELLTQKKVAHEEWVATQLAAQPTWRPKLSHLYYINVPRLSLLSSLHGLQLDLSRYGRINSLHELGWELNGLMGGFRELLKETELRAAPLDSLIMADDTQGMFVSFDRQFRTRNIRLPESGQSFETHFIGDLRVDPHIYSTVNGWKVLARIDRRWITTTTAFVHFRPSSGRDRFAGLGFINSVDPAKKVMDMTPYVLGVPSNPLMEALWGSDHDSQD